MFSAIRLLRTHPSSLSFPTHIGRKATGIRFQQAPAAGDSKIDKMATTQKGDVMSHSFGEGYASRSNEEGFGGTCGGNQTPPNSHEEDKIVHGNSPEYDKSQGSEVKEKEKARHQTSAQS